MKAIFFLITIIFLVILAVGFSSLNAGQVVAVKFLGLRMENEFSFFMFVSLLLGLCIGVFLMSFGLMKSKLRIRQLNKKLSKSEKSLKSAVSSLPAKV